MNSRIILHSEGTAWNGAVTLPNLLGSELNQSDFERNLNEIVFKRARFYIRTSSIGITSMNFSSCLSSVSLDEETRLVTLWSFVGIETAEVNCAVFSIYIKREMSPTFTSSKLKKKMNVFTYMIYSS